MFSIFSKKIKLSELYENATDMHNHLLPGIDDGSATIDTSIEMIRKFESLGFSNIYATPHTMSDFYPNTPETINQSLNQLTLSYKGPVKIKAASEYMIDSAFEDFIDKNPESILTFKDNQILVEQSFYRPYDRFEEVLYKLQIKGFQPILAHPERYLYYADDLSFFTTLKNKGVKLQLNTLSLTEHYGPKTLSITKKLLKNNLYDYMGTDAHKKEHLDKIETIKISNSFTNNLQTLLKNNCELF